MRTAFFVAALMIASPAVAQFPDGTLVLSSKPGTVIGNVAQRMASKDQGYSAKYTHMGIVLGGRIYHSDYPRVGTIPVLSHKRGELAHYYVPVQPYTPQQIAAMKSYAKSQIGKPYRLRGFVRPGTGQEGWCSTFVGEVLKRAGHNVGKKQRRTPDGVFQSVRTRFQYSRSVQR